jgi:hypothetical protein
MMSMALTRLSVLPRPQLVRPVPRFGNETPQVDYDALAKATQMQSQGRGISGRVIFRVETDSPLTREIAQEVQRRRGYDPRGYDFMEFASGKPQDSSKYVTTWKCSTSCD